MPFTRPLLLVSAFSLSLLLAQQPKGFSQPAPAREVTVSEIPGVIAAGAKWTQVWQGNETADGIVGTDDGGLLFAQEQTNRINKLDKKDKFSVYLETAHGPGAVAIGPKGRILVVERTCTDPGGHLGVKPEQCTEPTGVSELTPTRKVLADSIDGKGLGRVNDLVADKKGGAYFTSGGLFYLSPGGKVTNIGENLRTNGINLSPDEKTLYVTNGPVIVAFDVQADGSVKNQREFGKLEGGNGDGMAVDATGRIYDTTNPGIQVFGPDGKSLGLIPTPRNAISVAFSGPGKKTLYVACLGALDANGQEVRTAPGVRNVAMTIYKIPVMTPGFKGRAK
ncbi:MAG TPA: SMP-30/gluconolactonase/LRE family protein [Bryobacteraceae bacterium]|jgi:gluconolactonase|nr:SMP-30/gluconolactonase/LRE family protein [Bryobacteraceae bacterium]